jgi:hypothetical protein
MKGIITMKNIGGANMLKFSQVQKNGKLPNRVNMLLPKDQKNVDEKVARCKDEMSKILVTTMTMIKKLNIPSDRIEMYEFAITTAEQEIKKLQKFQNEVLVMYPFPIAEPDRQVSDYMISHHASDIARYKAEIELIQKMA